MKWPLYAGSAVVAALLCLPGAAGIGQAAQPSPPAGAEDPISFEQYRDWRVTFNDRRRSELAVQLSAPDLPVDRKAKLEQSKSYYDWLAGLPEAERDARFRERFDRIDANHDGTIDRTERAAWRDKQRVFYHHDKPARQSAATETH